MMQARPQINPKQKGGKMKLLVIGESGPIGKNRIKPAPFSCG
jgi:hypothetical protein